MLSRTAGVFIARANQVARLASRECGTAGRNDLHVQQVRLDLERRTNAVHELGCRLGSFAPTGCEPEAEAQGQKHGPLFPGLLELWAVRRLDGCRKAQLLVVRPFEGAGRGI